MKSHFFTLVFDVEDLGGKVRVSATAIHKNEDDSRNMFNGVC